MMGLHVPGFWGSMYLPGEQEAGPDWERSPSARVCLAQGLLTASNFGQGGLGEQILSNAPVLE